MSDMPYPIEQQEERCMFSEFTEKAVLGSVLRNPDVLYDLKSILTPQDFFFVRNGLVFDAMLHLHGKREAVDELTLSEELRARQQLDQIGGSAYLLHVMNETPTHVYADTYARIMFAMAQRRRWIDFAAEVGKLAGEANMALPAMTTEINDRYRDVTVRLRSRTMVGGKRLMDEVWQDFEYRLNNPAMVRGFSTGIDKIDRETMGLRPGLYAIGGASSMGKSTFAGGLVRSLAAQAPGVFVPTEVAGKKALEKIATDMAGIPYKHFLSGYLTQDQYNQYLQAHASLERVADNLTLCDTDQPSIYEIEAEILRSNAAWLLIDSGTAMAYQNMDMRSGKRQTDLRTGTTWLCQQLQNIARSGVVVIALWQTGRNAKGRESKVPRINDFKEAGAIEETADVCMALYRHDYYVKRKEADPDPAYPPGTATVYILKDRDGGNGDESAVLGFRPGHGFTAPIDPSLDGVMP